VKARKGKPIPSVLLAVLLNVFTVSAICAGAPGTSSASYSQGEGGWSGTDQYVGHTYTVAIMDSAAMASAACWSSGGTCQGGLPCSFSSVYPSHHGWDCSQWGFYEEYTYLGYDSESNIHYYDETWYAYPLIASADTKDYGSGASNAAEGADEANFEGPVFDNTVSNMVCVGSSVNLKSGNLFHSQRVGPLVFSYNSLDSFAGSLGAGWTHNFDLAIVSNSDGSLYLKRSDGNRIYFSADSGGVYHADAKSGDRFSTIVADTDGSYILRRRYGKIYTFNASGRLIRIEDRNGNATVLTYSGSDLVDIEDATGRRIAIATNGGKIVSITDFSSRVYSISYSGGLLSAIADPLGNTWSYVYDAAERMVEKIDPSGNLTAYTYDAVTGKLTSSIDPDALVKTIAYDVTNSISRVTEKDGGVWVHKYERALNVPLEVSDPYLNKTGYSYDSNGNLLSKTLPDGSITSFTYDAQGKVTSRTDALGNTTALAYNEQDRITSVTDARGESTLLASTQTETSRPTPIEPVPRL
jgi:YD repeat-containing protein